MTSLAALFPNTRPLGSGADVRITASRAARDVALLALYALGFLFTHELAARWSGAGYYSLWYPAAGLRLALLWRKGARWTVPLAVVELAVDLAVGAVPPRGADVTIAWGGAMRPVIAYGLVVWAVRRMTQVKAGALAAPPMPFALASMAAPILAALFTLPQALLRGDLTGVADAREIALSMAAFTTGDVLGTMLVAPPLLWAADRLAGRQTRALPRPRVARSAEAVAVLAAGALIGETFAWLDLGPQPAPALLAVTWIGLRFGRTAAWAAMMVVCAVVLPRTAGGMDVGERLQFHLGLASVVVSGYVAGSFRDAQVRARADVERRDRLLFQAERLKTLRAMSVAVIHEISQPLSTLAIEARHLHELTVGAPADVATTAALIDRKAAHLSELVRRLRRYGGRAVDEPSPLPLAALVDSVVALARPEVQAAGVGLAVAPVASDLVVLAQEVELAQAAVNLVRNAAQACGAGGEVTLAASRAGDRALLSIANRCAPDVAAHAGMGVGTLVARAIVEAHGGTLTREDTAGEVRATIALPLVGEAA